MYKNSEGITSDILIDAINTLPKSALIFDISFFKGLDKITIIYKNKPEDEQEYALCVPE